LIKPSTKKGCLFVLLGALVTTIIIVAALCIGISNTSSEYLQKFGISDIGELVNIVDAINEPINESDLIVGGFTANDYLTAKTKLLSSDIDIFDSISGDIDIEKISATTEFVPILSLGLTEAELGALLANATKNVDTDFISSEQEVKINLISFNMTFIDSDNEVLDCVLKIDTSSIKTDFGIFQSFIPEAIYLSFSVDINVAENYNVSVSNIIVNDLSESKNEKVLNVICAIIKSEIGTQEYYTIANFEANFSSNLENCINALMQKIVGVTAFTISGIELNIAG